MMTSWKQMTVREMAMDVKSGEDERRSKMVMSYLCFLTCSSLFQTVFMTSSFHKYYGVSKLYSLILRNGFTYHTARRKGHK